MMRSSQQQAEIAAQQAAREAARRIAAEKAAQQADDDSPIFLSVQTDPPEGDVVATWKDGGEKKGQAPLSFEVPHNVKVHFAFSKAGYLGLEMDVIADQAQNVKGTLKPAPVAAVEASEKHERTPSHTSKKAAEKKADAPPSKDGLIDLDDALK
jgi:hypothetical protein